MEQSKEIQVAASELCPLYQNDQNQYDRCFCSVLLSNWQRLAHDYEESKFLNSAFNIFLNVVYEEVDLNAGDVSRF